MTGSEIGRDVQEGSQPPVVAAPAVVTSPAGGAAPPPVSTAGRERGSRWLLAIALVAGIGVGAAIWGLLGTLAFPTFAASVPIERANVQLGTLLVHVGLVLVVIAFVPQTAFWLANLVGDLWPSRRAVAREAATADRTGRWTLHPAMVGILLAGLGVLLLGLTAFAQPISRQRPPGALGALPRARRMDVGRSSATMQRRACSARPPHLNQRILNVGNQAPRLDRYPDPVRAQARPDL